MAKKLLVDVVKHKDIRGKELLYLVVGEGDTACIVNIGEKTFNTIDNLLRPKEKEAELTIQTPKNEGK